MRQYTVGAQYIKRVLIFKVLHSRTYSVLILQLFVNYMNIKPLIEFSEAVNYKVSPWVFPFMVSEYHYAFLFLLMVVYYFSDVPFMQHQNMYQVIRTGRRRWAMSQICVLVLQSFFLVGANIFMSALLMLPNLEFTTEWGKVLHTIALTNAGSHYDLWFPITYQAMEQSTPLQMLLCAFGMGGLVVAFVGLAMFAVSLLINRLAAVAVGTIMTLMIFLVQNAHPVDMAKVCRFVPANWIRVANIGMKELGGYMTPSLSYMLTVLIIGIVIFCTAIIIRIKRVEFHWNNED